MSKESKGSRDQEERAAERDGGRRVSRSGAGDLKGDVSIQSKKRIAWMKECKRTWKDWIAVKWGWWDTLEQHAMFEQKDPILEIEFGRFILVGFNYSKFNELMTLANWVSPVRLSVKHYENKWDAGQLTIHLYELEAHMKQADCAGSVPVLKLHFRSNEKDLLLIFLPASFATKLMEKVYGKS